MNVDQALAYIEFAAERHRVWEARQRGEEGPWTDDPVLASRKFTNVFRILDPGSQYALQLVDGADSAADALFLALAYRQTNIPRAWRWMYRELGGSLGIEDAAQIVELLKAYRGWGESVFSAAYKVHPGHIPGVDKIDHVIDVALRATAEAGPTVTRTFATLEEKATRLKRCYGMGDFMVMQVLTDYGYSRYGADQDENDYAALGPGSRRGAEDLGLPRSTAITDARKLLLSSDECPMLDLGGGRLRAPSLMDVQNTLCEWSKYVRLGPGAGMYRAAHPGLQQDPVLPEHW